jgi:hypothetical protein
VAQGWLFHPGNDLHKGRFAGPVLANQNIHGTFANFEIGAFDRDNSRIYLGHVFEFEDNLRFIQGRHFAARISRDAGEISGNPDETPC